MRTLQKLFIWAGLASGIAFNALAQGTAFTYQGRLDDGGNPANGIYDLRFGIYDAITNGNQEGDFITNNATEVSNGLFTVMLDFGPGIFTGPERWLDIGVVTNGGGEFVALSPRQLLTPTPYAIRAATADSAASANSVLAGNITGTLSAAQLPASVVTNGATGVSFNGTFIGNGAGVTNVSLGNINSDGSITWPGNFVLATSPAVGSRPSSVVAADINGDGKLDLICANSGANTLSVLTNNGSGGFVLASTLAVGHVPQSVTAADINGDGQLDLICANSGDNTLSVLTNNGSGGFVLASSPAVGSAPDSVVAVDVNGDGKVDLICANSGTNTLSVLTNNGSGGFVPASSPVTSLRPISVTAADVNGDGKVDLICVGLEGPGAFSVLTNKGSGQFVLASLRFVSNPPISVVAADINGDGKVDFITADLARLSVFTNDGSGGFELASTPGAGTAPDSVIAADVKGDGKVDLICANRGDNTLSILTNNGSGGFVLATNIGVGSNPVSVTAADVNEDGKVDLICADYLGNSLSVLFNGPGFNFKGLNSQVLNFEGGFGGNGSGLTNLNASQLTIGTVPDPALAGFYTNQVNFDNGLDSFSGSFIGNGSGLINLNASRLMSGTVPGQALGGTYSNAVTFNNASNSFTGKFIGNGSGLTNLNALQLTSGTVPGSALAGTYSNAVTFNNAASSFSGGFAGNFIGTGSFSGNGSGLTNLNASQLTSGTVPGQAIAGTYGNAVTFNNPSNLFAGNFTGSVGIGTNNPQTTLHVVGNILASGTIRSPMAQVANVINTNGPLNVTTSFASGGGTLIIFASGSGYTLAANARIGMNVVLDGTNIDAVSMYAQRARFHMPFVPKTIVKSGVAAGNHTLVLAPLAGTVTDTNDSFDVTIQEVPY